MPGTLILVVDDEPVVVRACSIAISNAGYEVAVAENGAVGLAMFRERRDEICLVLTDVVMPVMDGIEMAYQILVIDPAMKILVMTGYGDSALQAQEKFPVMRKPFLMADLMKRIEDTIGKTDSAVGSAG